MPRTVIGTERRPGRTKQVVWEELSQGSMGVCGWVPKQRDVLPFNALVLQSSCSLSVLCMNACMWNNAGGKKSCWVSQATISLIVYWWTALGNVSGRWWSSRSEGEMLTQMCQRRCFCARAACRAGMHLYGKWWGAEEISILSCKIQRENSEYQGEGREWMEQEKTDVKGYVS